jgi:hypothetical protein
MWAVCMSRHQNAAQKHSNKIANIFFEYADLKYLGMTVFEFCLLGYRLTLLAWRKSVHLRQRRSQPVEGSKQSVRAYKIKINFCNLV